MPRQDDQAPLPPRLLGSYGGRPGPTLVVVAGLHGNEPAGVIAFRRVAAQLAEAGVPLEGRLFGLRGNCRSLAAGVRYLDEDLNRMWARDLVAALDVAADPGTNPSQGKESAEATEQRELLAALEDVVAGARGGDVSVLDLHTTSSASAPFAVVGDAPASRRLAAELPIPHVRGLAALVPGTLKAFLAEGGMAAVGVEGGQHQAGASADRLAAVLRLALAATGSLGPGALPRLDADRAFLRAAAAGVPRELDLVYRHAISRADAFVMRPGFANFDAVAAGTPLADDRRGPVLAPMDGHLLMPLYQGLGDDGFFLVRPAGRS